MEDARELIWTALYLVLVGAAGWAMWKYWGFFRECYIELRHKVTWPGRKEVQGTTIVVLIATVAFAVYLFVCDIVFQWTLMGIIQLSHNLLGGA